MTRQKVKRLFFVIAAAFLFASHNLYAATWKVIDEDDIAIRYIDTSSVDTVGSSIVRLVLLTNFKHRYVPMISSLSVIDFQCGRGAYRTLRTDTFTELYAGGQHIGTMTPKTFGENPTEFHLIGNDENYQLMRLEYNFACKTKYSSNMDQRLKLSQLG